MYESVIDVEVFLFAFNSQIHFSKLNGILSLFDLPIHYFNNLQIYISHKEMKVNFKPNKSDIKKKIKQKKVKSYINLMKRSKRTTGELINKNKCSFFIWLIIFCDIGHWTKIQQRKIIF